jgi:hypothetical protein
MMRKRRLLIASGLVAIVFLLAGAFALAQPEQGTPATLLVLEGHAEVIQKGTFGFNNSAVTVSDGQAMAVRAGDKINLGLPGSARLRFSDGSTVDLFEYTSLEINELLTTEKSYRVRLTLLTGRTLSSVSRALGIGDAFEIRTPSSTASVRGTVFRVDVITPEWTYVSCDRGAVHVTMGDQFVDLQAGEEVNAIAGRPLLVQPQAATSQPAAPLVETAPTEPPPPTNEPTPTDEAAETTQNTSPASNAVEARPQLSTVTPPLGNATQPPPTPEPTPSVQVPPPLPTQAPPPAANPPSPPDNPPVPPNNPSDPPDNAPNPPPQVPGNPPGDTPGNPPGGGGLPPGQGGSPPGQNRP